MYVTYTCETCGFECEDEWEMEQHEEAHEIENNIDHAKFYTWDGTEMDLEDVIHCTEDVFFIVNATADELAYLCDEHGFDAEIDSCYSDPEDIIYYDDDRRCWYSAKRELGRIQEFVDKVSGASK